MTFVIIADLILGKLADILKKCSRLQIDWQMLEVEVMFRIGQHKQNHDVPVLQFKVIKKILGSRTEKTCLIIRLFSQHTICTFEAKVALCVECIICHLLSKTSRCFHLMNRHYHHICLADIPVMLSNYQENIFTFK